MPFLDGKLKPFSTITKPLHTRLNSIEKANPVRERPILRRLFAI